MTNEEAADILRHLRSGALSFIALTEEREDDHWTDLTEQARREAEALGLAIDALQPEVDDA